MPRLGFDPKTLCSSPIRWSSS